MKYYIIYFCLLTCICNGMVQPGRKPYPLAQKKCTQDIPGLEGLKNNGFLASFLGNGSSIIIPPPISYPGMPHLLTILPHLGQYSDEYPTQGIIGLIQLDPTTMIQNIPANIKNKIPINPLQSFNFNILISGTLDKPIHGLTYNFVLHPWGYGFMKQNYFNITASVGFYDVNGITLSDLGNNQQRPLNINAHNGGSIYFSPDNGKFTIQQGREIATFWSLALSPGNKNVLVTFHIIVNSPAAKNNFIQAGQQARILGGYLQNIERTVIPTLKTELDKNTLTNAITTIKTILSPQQIISAPPQTIEGALKQFETSMQNLAGKI